MAAHVREDTTSWVKVSILIVIGAAILICVGILEYRNVSTSMVTTVDTSTAKMKVSTVKGTPTSGTFLEAAAGVGAALVVAGAFYGRLSKLVLPGGVELDFDTTATIGAKAAAAAQGDPSTTKKIAKEATKRATAMAEMSKGQPDANGFVTLAEDQISTIVLNVAKDLNIDGVDPGSVQKRLV